MVKIAALVVSTRWVMKIKEHLHFVENSTYFVLKLELLLTMLPKFEGEAVLKTQLFDK